jgi:hypothetical protein
MSSWVHFGDRHASNDDRYQRLGHPASMIQLVNRYLSVRSTVTALMADGRSAEDSILLHGASHADQHLVRHPAPGTHAHAVEPGAEHGIVGSESGPNKNGRHR